MNHAGLTSADQPGTPPNRSTAARQRDFAEQAIDPRGSADQLQSDLATVLAQKVNEATQGHKTLTVRTAPRSDPSHPLAENPEGLSPAEQTSELQSGASPFHPVLSPVASRESQESFAGQVLAHARSIGAKVHHDAVSFAAIAKNPSLARQARAELDEHQHTTAIEKIDTDGPVASSAFYAHDAEVERQWAALEAVNADTKEESTLNKELSFLICARLEASRRSSERLLGVLQVMFITSPIAKMATWLASNAACHASKSFASAC